MQPPRPEEPSQRPETFGELFLKSRLAPDRCSRVTCVMQRPSFPNNGGCVGRRVWREAGTDGEGEVRGSGRSDRQLPHPQLHPHPSRNWPPSSSAEHDWPQRGGAEGGGSVHATLSVQFPSFLFIRSYNERTWRCCMLLCVRAMPANLLLHTARKKSERRQHLLVGVCATSQLALFHMSEGRSPKKHENLSTSTSRGCA